MENCIILPHLIYFHNYALASGSQAGKHDVIFYFWRIIAPRARKSIIFFEKFLRLGMLPSCFKG
jgi:hypothetical protein